MSLLEDVFLQDEAGEAQELERIIEGDDYDERPRSPENSDDNSEKEDEAEEDKSRVDPSTTKTKREVKHPRFVLNPARLTGPRGIQILPEHFKDFKFRGKGHEKEDLDLVLKKLEHWAYRLYPKFQFVDCLKKIETLGKKRPVMVHLHKIRSDQLLTEETVVQRDSSDDEPQPPPEDEFDKLLQQQIDLARATPTSVRKRGLDDTPGDHRSPLNFPSAPKATSSPSISDDQRERMILNRKLAEERRLAKLRALTNNSDGQMENGGDKNGNDKGNDENARRKNVADENNSRNDFDDKNYDSDEDIRGSSRDRNGNFGRENNDDVVIDIVSNDNPNNKKRTARISIDNDFESLRQERVDDTFGSVRQDRNVAQKKRKSQVIDTSDSSDNEFEGITVNESVSVDIHRVSSQIESAKGSYSSKIATNDLVGNEVGHTKKENTKINVEKAMDGEIIDLEEQGIRFNQGNAKVIDITESSHSTGGRNENENIPTIDLVDLETTRTTSRIKDGETIDLVEDTENLIRETKENKKGAETQKILHNINVFDSSDEDSVDFMSTKNTNKENDTDEIPDLVENPTNLIQEIPENEAEYEEQKKIKKINVIESSGEDTNDKMNVTCETDSNGDLKENYPRERDSENNSESPEKSNVNVALDAENISETVKENQKNKDENVTKSLTNYVENKKSPSNIVKVSGLEPVEDTVKIASSKINVEVTHDKENIKGNVVKDFDEDLMDVDFSDEF